MTAPANLTAAYTAVIDALGREVAGNPETLGWLDVADRLVTIAEGLVAVPEIPVSLPGVLVTAQAMLDRVTQHAAASDPTAAGRWLGHLEQLVGVTRRLAAISRPA